MTDIKKTTNLKGTPPENAFNFLKSKYNEMSTDKRKRGAPSAAIADNDAKRFTDRFRETTTEFNIPISLSFDTEALVNLLGITDYEHYPEVNGVRFYVGINDQNMLTLIAVSTTPSNDPNTPDRDDDLTVDDEYPFYDYADPCPTNCSKTGNLSAESTGNATRDFIAV